jgi:molybdate transport system regulatory protein
MPGARLTLRIDLGPEQSIGPGKMRLLEAVEAQGSISGAGRALGMSYRRAWLLIDDMNQTFREPVVATQLGGKEGGGASLTPFGQKILARYRAIEAGAARATARDLAFLASALREKAPRGAGKRPRLAR